MTSKKYACLSCGYVHDGKTERKRVDSEGCNAGPHPSRGSHGVEICRVCPECGHRHRIDWEDDEV